MINTNNVFGNMSLIFDQLCGAGALNANQLSVEEKRWLGEQIISKRATAAQISQKLGLVQSTLYRYSNWVRKEHRMEEEVGRPRCLDDISINAIFEAIRNLPSMSDAQLRNVIKKEYTATYSRRHDALDEGDEVIEMPRRSLKRYFEYFDCVRE